MNTFFKNLFTRRAFNIIVGICGLINIGIFFTDLDRK